jgi:hypothetical protein
MNQATDAMLSELREEATGERVEPLGRIRHGSCTGLCGCRRKTRRRFRARETAFLSQASNVS